NFYDITINLEIFEKGDFIFELRFTMYQAWWTPFYDISLTENQAELTMMANVFNRTGLDWEDISVQISTASLKPVKLIKPDPMILKEYSPPVYKAKRRVLPSAAPKKARKMDRADAPTGGMAMDEEKEAFMEEPAPEIEESYADVSENLGVQSFQISNRINIPSDKNPHPVNLTKEELESQKAYFWSSAAPENVIIRDSLQNTDLLLLSGNAKVYYLEEFLGETEIPLIAPKEEFKLGTRISYDLKVDKKLIDRSKDKKALRGKLKNYYEYQIKIKNLNDTEEDLTIYDRIPHSSSENIQVTIEEINLEPDKKELGVMKWEINMKGVQEKIIKYRYYVEYKSGTNIRPPLP
ncbi:MAG: mucoidy inhibitor MuiA family protein, partial [Candidatus Lokiarchaeota archaeon]|nr:mucoidy inhibitor MuiA family protein [Candidatus Lokiarchaeota archaeon]MBD3201760.1 mucoidy inhibitor MuiA family protein [Candidatus Lokiarchaeota archaeon]